MLKFTLIAVIFITFSNANILKLSKEEIQYIKTLPNYKVIAKRFGNYYKFLNEAKSYDLNKKLIRTNLDINKILPRKEETDSWSPPKVFLINGYGDCEDYVLAKYFSLIHLGIKKENLFSSVVKVKGSYGLHMVLIHRNIDNELMVLDNLSWKILPLKEREDLSFKYAFNEFGSYRLEDDTLKKESKVLRRKVKVLRKIARSN
jgi:predicted transglutaminase-like cysteine proteinase